MPLSAPERRQVGVLVVAFLTDEIHGQFLDLYAAAVSATEKHPEQVNNELRNALTHLSRAVVASDMQIAHAEMSKAAAHVERAKRDAVKIAVISLRDRIADACADIKRLEGYLDPAFLVRRDEIAKTRKRLLKQEAKGGRVLNEFVQLYLDTDALNDDLHAQLALSGKRRPRWHYWLYSMRRQFAAAIVGLLLGVAASVAYSVLAPDSQAFGNSIRRTIGLHADTPPLKLAAPPPPPATAASIPSTGG